jgi:iron complex transport system ATP-binding protein
LTSQSTSVDAAAAGGQAPALRLDGVCVWRWHAGRGARVPIADEITWAVGPGECWALLGPNGAGKTTLLTIAGAVEFPSSGTVEILGERLGGVDVAGLRERIGLVDARLGHRFAPLLSVRAVVRTGTTGTIGYFEERLDTRGRSRAEELLELFGLDRIASRRFRDCSHGERKRALIARALAAEPRLLLLDEPGAGLDLPGRETMLGALSRLARDRPELAIVVTTHHLEELPAATTHALLLREGRVVVVGPVDDALTDAALGRCFDLPVRVTRAGGRWSATAIATL